MKTWHTNNLKSVISLVVLWWLGISKKPSLSFHAFSCASSFSTQTFPLLMRMSKGLLLSLSLSLSSEMLPRHRAAAAAFGWLKHPTASPPASPLREGREGKTRTGNPGASVQMPTSLRHQLNLSLLCSATKRRSPRSPLCPPTAQPSLGPGHFSLPRAGARTRLLFKENTRPGRSET